ncbi:MAG: hypothetical protein WDA65_02025 [Christensenellales bacterium]
MKKVIIITMLLTAAAVIGIIILMGGGVDTEALRQSDCEGAVRDFTEGKQAEFVRKIDSNDKNDFNKQNYLGYYVFEDDLYTYIVDPDNLYLCSIDVMSNEAWTSLYVNGEKAGTEEAAAQIAIDIFKKIESKFLIKGEIITNITTPTETMYVIEVIETRDGIPTGNCASTTISKSGNLLSGVFLIGDAQHMEKLNNQKDKMISFKAAAQIAVDEIKAQPELAAENIVVDETRKDEMSTRGNITTRFVYLTYYKDGEQREAMVLVDAFSGEVVSVGYFKY